jgi:hypothetical protein
MPVNQSVCPASCRQHAGMVTRTRWRADRWHMSGDSEGGWHNRLGSIVKPPYSLIAHCWATIDMIQAIVCIRTEALPGPHSICLDTYIPYGVYYLHGCHFRCDCRA